MKKNLIRICFILPYTLLYCLPQQATVKSGLAEFSYEDNTLSIHCGNETFLDWQNFSIEPREEVRFLQEGPHSLAVNRVITHGISELQGSLQSNGRIVLINPNGIWIGKTGVIDTGAFIASSLDLLDLRKEDGLHFAGNSPASVKNEGSIMASNGDALLLGFVAENTGTITARNGVAALLAGREVVVKADGENKIYIRPTLESLSSEHFTYSSAFVHDGAEDALEFDGEFLVSKAINRGTLSSQYEREGGSVFVLGEQVELNENSHIDVSHHCNGGKVYIGGGYQGSDSHLMNAKKCWLGQNSTITANSLEYGDGGRVIVWAEEASAYYGNISAEAGPMGGNGGFVEISGRNSLAFHGKVSTYAPKGITGSLLLDPNDIQITAGATSGGAFAGVFFDGAGFQPAILNNTELGAALDMNNVLIQTSAPTVGGSGDISIEANVTWTTAGTSLTINAIRDLTILDGITVSAAGAGANITLNAGRNIDCRGRIRNNEFATMTGGNVTLTAATGSINIGSSISLVSPSGAVTNIFGQIQISAPVGNINLLGGAALNSYAIIGNDNNRFTLAPALSSGNILIEAGLNFLMLGGSNTSTQISVSRLPIPPFGTPPMTNNVIGNITVNVGQDLTLQSGTSGNLGGRTDGAFIGHGMGGGYNGANTARSRIGNILVNVGRDLTMTHSRATSVGTGDPTSIPFIGTNRVTSALLGYTGSITINVGNNLLMHSLPAGGRLNAPVIGSQSTGAIADTGNYQIPLYINVGGNFCMDARNSIVIVGTQNNGALAAFPPELFIHVGGNLALVGGNSNGNVGVSAQIRHNTAAADMRYQAWTGGSIVCLNGFNAAAGGYAELHLPTTFSAAAGAQRVLYGTNVRSGGDIRVAGGSPVPAGVTYSSNGAIFYQADSPFATGELWAARTAIVNGTNIFTGTPLGNASPAQASDGIGAILFDFQRYNNTAFNCATLAGSVVSPNFPVSRPIVYQAHNGQDITMLTSDQFATLAGPADFTSGTGNGQISFDNSAKALASQNQPIPGGNIRIEAFRNITITGPSLTAPAGNILAIANNDFGMITNANAAASGSVTLVSDNQAPTPPLIGPGGFTIDDTSQINAGTTIRIFTAVPNNPPTQNSISLLALINGQTIGDLAAAFGFPNFPGTPFLSDSLLEIYCTYYNLPAGDIFAGSNLGGLPFTIFYKPCHPQVVNEATIIVDQLLVSFHPYNEFPGWLEKFWLICQDDSLYFSDMPYYLRRRNLNVINHPKSYTQLMPY